jgi:hypothetical protein
MKKRDRLLISALSLIIIVLLVVIGVLITKEKKVYYPWPIGEESQIQIYEGDEVGLELKEGTLSLAGAAFILKNNGEYDTMYDKMYRVEIKIDGKWLLIGRYGNWMKAGYPGSFYPFPAGSRVESEEDWGNPYGQLIPGTYRYVRRIFPSDGGSTTYAACEFKITKEMFKEQSRMYKE